MKHSYRYYLLCLVLILFSKQLSAQVPYPVADFITCKNNVEIYDAIRITDKSTNNPTKWYWKIYDDTNLADVKDLSTGDVDYNPNVQNVEVSFYSTGRYTVELRVVNSYGTSLITKKIEYLHCSDYPHDEITMTKGHFQTNALFGYIRSGLNPGYSNNTDAALLINPGISGPVSASIRSLKLTDINDSVILYDGDAPNPSKVLAVLTSADNNMLNTFTALSGKMYMTFSSDSAGNNGSFDIIYYAKGYNPYDASQGFELVHDHAMPIAVYNNRRNVFSANYYTTWFINGGGGKEF